MSEYYDKFMALSREQKSRLYEIENDNSFDDPEAICCPYCDTPQSNLEGPDVSYEDENEQEHTCINSDCEKKFTISTSVSYSWSTKLDDEEAMEILESELKESK